MKNWMMVLILMSLVIPFQNCSKPNSVGIDNGGVNGQASGQTADAKVSTLQPSQAESIEMPLSSISKASEGGDQAESILIYPKTGVIDPISPSGERLPTDQYCLNSSQIAVLEGLLNTAKICEANDTSQASEGNMNCTALYKSPYAKLNFVDQIVSLGEMRSGCQKGTDLCGSSSQNLKNFLLNVIVDLPNLKCNFQAI